jgi:DNA ligase 1
MADALPEVMDALRQLPRAALDGEFVAPNRDGRSNFEALRRRALLRRSRKIGRSSASMPAILVVFDVLEDRGCDLRALPLSDPSSRAVRAGRTEHLSSHFR